MKLHVNAGRLNAACKQLLPLINHRSALPILCGVLLKASAGNLQLTVNTLDVSLTISIAAVVEQPGATVLMLSPLVKFISTIAPDVELELQHGKEAELRATVNGRSLISRMASLHASEFPPMGSFASLATLELPGARLAQVFGDLIDFTSTDETRYVINGVLLDASAETVKAIATDGRRIRITNLGKSAKSGGVLRKDFVKTVTDMCAGKSDPVRIEIGELSVSATGADWLVEGRMIEGNYPNYRQIIPSHSASALTFKTSDVQWALEVCGAGQTAKNSGVKLLINGDTVTFRTGDEDRSMEVAIPVRKSGTPENAIFNVDFLRAIVDAHPEEEITFDQKHDLAPVRIDTADTTSVLIPIRIS